MGPEAACTTFTDAAGARQWGAFLGDASIQSAWPKLATREGINWKELCVLKEALRNWRYRPKRKLVLVRMGNATATAYANHGAGRSGQLISARD